jgi:hypothetical protein
MASKQEEFRNRVVTFYLNNRDKPRTYTVHHFMAEGKSRRTIDNIITTYEKRLTTERKSGSGCTPKVMTKEKVESLYRLVNHKDRYNYASAGRKYGTSGQTIKYWLNKRFIKLFKKKKCPKYSETENVTNSLVKYDICELMIS